MSLNERIRAAILMQEGEFSMDSLLQDFPRFPRSKVVSQLAMCRQAGDIATVHRGGKGTGQGTHTIYVRSRKVKDPEFYLATLMQGRRYDAPHGANP